MRQMKLLIRTPNRYAFRLIAKPKLKLAISHEGVKIGPKRAEKPMIMILK